MKNINRDLSMTKQIFFLCALINFAGLFCMNRYARGQELFYLLQPPRFKYATPIEREHYYQFYISAVKRFDPDYYQVLCHEADEYYRRNPMSYTDPVKLRYFNKIRKIV